MRRLLLVLAFAAGCNCRDDRLVAHSPCGEPCYTGPSTTRDKGSCHSGTLWCDEDGGTICADQVLPGDETCGEDNNCDGKPDKFGVTRSCYSGDAGTLGKGICHSGWQTCQKTGWGVCGGEQLPLTENCLGNDANCDGVIDNIPPTPCYDGGLDTLTIPGCHYGYEACRNRQIACVNEATYHPLGGSYDVVFVITTDGSMRNFQSQIETTLTNWCTQRTNTRCALVIAPDSNIDIGGTDGGLFLAPYQLSPLNTPTFLSMINNVQYQPNFWAGDVSINDAIYYSCDIGLTDSLNPLSLGWNGSSTRAVVYFTDEEAQFVRNPWPTTDVGTMCASNRVSVFGFSGGKEFNSSAYDNFSQSIHNIDPSLSANLNTLFPGGSCY